MSIITEDYVKKIEATHEELRQRAMAAEGEVDGLKKEIERLREQENEAQRSIKRGAAAQANESGTKQLLARAELEIEKLTKARDQAQAGREKAEAKVAQLEETLSALRGELEDERALAKSRDGRLSASQKQAAALQRKAEAADGVFRAFAELEGGDQRRGVMARSVSELSVEALWKFLSRVEIGPTCWRWRGTRSGNGYAQLRLGRDCYQAHRLGWEIQHERPVAEGLTLDHTCRNAGCVNPAHLDEVTHGENVRRGDLWQRRVTACPQGHLYDARNTRHARGRRYCIACDRERRKVASSAA